MTVTARKVKDLAFFLDHKKTRIARKMRHRGL